MKRLVLLGLGIIIVGRLYVMAVVHLTKSGPERTHLNVENALNAHRQLGPLADANRGGPPMMRSMPPRAVIPQRPRPVVIAANVPVAKPKVAAQTPKKAEEKKKTPEEEAKEQAEKDEAERRKERRKNLEQQTAANSGTGAGYQVTSQIQYQPPMPAYAGGVLPQQQQATPGNSPAEIAHPLSVSGGGTSTGAGSNTNISYWTNILVTAPTSSLINSFVAMFNSDQITSSQFYQVLDSMQKSPVTLSRQYALQAAGMFQRAESFEIIADESVTETDPTTKNEASTELNVYNNVNDLSVFSQALSSGDTNAKIVALNMVNTVVATMQPNSVPANVAQSLSGMLPELTRLAQAPGAAQSAASVALQTVTKLIG